MTVPPEDEYRDRIDDRNAELRQLFFESAQELLPVVSPEFLHLTDIDTQTSGEFDILLATTRKACCLSAGNFWDEIWRGNE